MDNFQQGAPAELLAKVRNAAKAAPADSPVKGETAVDQSDGQAGSLTSTSCSC